MIQLLLTYRYIIIFPLALLEGPVLALVIGFLIKLGYFNFFAVYGVMIAGDFLPDSLYYYIGHYSRSKKWVDKLAQKFTSKKNAILDNMAVVEKLWKEHPKKMMFFSKLSYGLSTILLISTGLVKMSYARFLSYAFPITLIQYAVFLSVGYYLGSSYSAAIQYIHYGGYIMAIVFVILIALYFYGQKVTRDKMLSDIKAGEAK